MSGQDDKRVGPDQKSMFYTPPLVIVEMALQERVSSLERALCTIPHLLQHNSCEAFFQRSSNPRHCTLYTNAYAGCISGFQSMGGMSSAKILGGPCILQGGASQFSRQINLGGP